MSYGAAFLLLPAALVFLFCRGVREEKKRKQALRKRLLESCGKPPRPGRQEEKPDSYLRALEKDFVIDGITWEELEMETVFRRLDYTLSQAGTEYLYAALHCPAENAEEAEIRDTAAAYFMAHDKERVQVQEILEEIGKEKGRPFSLCAEALEKEVRIRPVREYMGLAAYIPAALLTIWTGGPGFCLIVFVILFQTVAYFRERAKILPYLKHIAWLLGMIRGLEKLYHVLPEEIRRETERTFHMDLGDCIGRLRTLRYGSFWVMQCGRAGNGPLSLFGDYIRMLLHPDIIQFGALLNRIRTLQPEIRKCYACIGHVDGCISIGMYRMSLETYCIPALHGPGEGDGLRILAADCVHPLLESPVANSIRTAPGMGILLTGSNASGKSTFLKTIAVNLLLAQTIHTALASDFSAPFCRIYTAMGDNREIRSGESSYMAEILSLKRIMDAAGKGHGPIVCFVDEILRGTGTVERIAASARILEYIRPPEMLCFVATHDRELTWLLEKAYDNYYFTEEIRDGDMVFPYRLLPGRADKSNAIRLLAAVGYDPEIVAGASRRAACFLKEGIWK